jgi:ABC-type Na+ efflux pump permease subunit
VLLYAYLAWLFVQLLIVLGDFRTTPILVPWSGGLHSIPPIDVRAHRAWLKEMQLQEAARTAAAARHLSVLLHQQLLLLLLLTPAVAAGSLGYEKERNTLLALFGTELTDREIVIGKLLGRLAVLLRVAAATLPLLVALAVLADVAEGRVLMACAQAVVLTFAVAAVSMLAAVWTRRTSDAILACYATLILLYLARTVLLASVRMPAWLDPQAVLEQLVTPESTPQALTVALHLAAWGGAGVLALALAAARLRPACLGQLEDRPHRWLWALRPAVGNDPVRWRERHVIGLAPLPWLRMVPGWMGMLGVFSFSAILAYTSLDYVVGPGFLTYIRRGDWAWVARMVRGVRVRNVTGELALMGGALLVIGTVAVGVRCANSIAEEKRRKTWEDLILTPLSLEEIVRGKTWGVLQAIPPYLAAYALPMFALAALAGTVGLVIAAAWVAGSALCMFGAAWLGMEFSAAKEDSGDGPEEDTLARYYRLAARSPASPGWGPGTHIQLPPQ